MKIAVVTGASSGMGREFVLGLERYISPDEIWVIARRADALKALEGQTAAAIRPICLDLEKDESFDAYAAMLAKETPDVLLLVNAAGFGRFGDFDAVPLDADERMIDLNCKALVRMTRLTLPYMNKGARILELDSLSAFQPVPYITTYAATKAFVLSYTRSVNAELKPRGIKAMAMCPGWVKTEFFRHAFPTNGGRVQYFNKLFEARDVVVTALRCLYKTNKDVCVPGFSVRLQVLGVKLLPHRLVMKIWMSQQKKPKNNQGLA